MNPRTTRSLLLLALLVTVAAWWDAGRTEFHFQRDLDQPLPFPEGAIEGLAIETPTLEARLERRENGWWLRAPIEFPAESLSVSAITRLARELRVRGEGGGADGTGLDAPRATLRLAVTGRGEATVAIGAPHPTLPYIYARVADEVVLIDPTLGELLEVATVEDLRSSALVDIPAIRAERLTVERGEERVTARRRGEEWRVVEPTVAAARAGAVIDALHALNAWGVHSFVADGVSDPEELAEFGLARPTGRIEVEERHTGRTVKLRWGDRTELPEGGGAGVFVLIEESGTVVRATAAVLPRLPRGSEEWESRRLVRIPDRSVDLVTVLGRYRKVLVGRDGRGGWTVTWAADGVPRPGESSRIVTMVESLRGAEVERYEPLDSSNLQRYGFDRPGVDLTLRHAGGEERIMVGDELASEPGLHYVWNYRWSRVGVAVVPDLDRWSGAPFSLRALDVVPIPPESAGRVRVRSAGTERTWIRGSAGWSRIGGGGIVSEEVAGALDRLLALRAERWDPAPPPLGEPLLEVEILPIEPIDADPWLTLSLGGAEGELRPVRLSDGGGTLLVPVGRVGDPVGALLEELSRP